MQRALAENVRTMAAPGDPEERIDGVRIGTVAAIHEDGTVGVDHLGGRGGPWAAKLAGGIQSLAASGGMAPGQRVLLLFEDGDPRRPVVIDTVHDRVETPAPMELEAPEPLEDVTVDGRRITFDAREEIVLRCGKSSITLTRAGKIIIRGAYLLNRSSGVNRIKGASVQIN